MCRQWQLLAGSAEASLSADTCWLTWQQPWPPEGPVLRHVQKCKLALCTDRLYLADFSWPQLPALTAVHIEARLTTTRGLNPVTWNNTSVRDLSVTVLRTKEHCLAHGESDNHNILALGVASSSLQTLRMRAIVAETGLLAHGGSGSGRLDDPVGVYIDLQLNAVPELRQLLVCSHWVRVSGGQKGPSADWDRPAVRFRGLRAAFLTTTFGVKLTSGGYVWAAARSGYRAQPLYAELQEMLQLCKIIDPDDEQSRLRGSLRLASDMHNMQQLQMYFENGCYT